MAGTTVPYLAETADFYVTITVEWRVTLAAILYNRSYYIPALTGNHTEQHTQLTGKQTYVSWLVTCANTQILIGQRERSISRERIGGDLRAATSRHLVKQR
jgi:hypothetical protein